MQRINYDKKLDALISAIPQGEVPSLLLHACCAPCSSAVLLYLSEYFRIYLLFYNPNISPREEYDRRASELYRLCAQLPQKHAIQLIPTSYRAEDFEAVAQGLEQEPEGGLRCHRCYELRLEEAAKEAQRLHCDYFTTTLSISPMKNAQILNQIAESVAQCFGTRHLPSDFKKKGGYQRSIVLSEKYGLYRQDYCGCIYSKLQREAQKRKGQLQKETEA